MTLEIKLNDCIENSKIVNKLSIRKFILAAQWFVYYLRCVDNSLYAGITTDLDRRLTEHNNCNKSGAKYTRVRRPVSMVYHEVHLDRKSASQREYQLKQLTKLQKEKLVSNFISAE